MEERLTVRIGADLKDFERKMSRMQSGLSNTGGKMQKVGGIFTAASAAIVGGVTAAAAGLYGLTNKATETADAIAKGSERMGISTDAYQEMDFWASQNGLSQEQMEKAVGRLNQRLGLAVDGNEKYATALERLGIDLGAVEDGTLSTEDAMAQSIQTLSEMENENEKAALASELFGTKMSRDLLPALNDGSLSMEEAKDMAAELGIVMSEDQLKAAEQFQDSQDQIKRSLSMVGMEIGLELMPHFERMHQWILDNLPQIKDTISGAFESVIDTVGNVINWWNDLSDNMKKIIPIISGLALAFGPVMLALGTVVKAIGGVIGIFAPMMAAITEAGGLVKWFGVLLKPLGAVFTALTGPVGLTVAAIAALGAGFVLAYNKSETFRNFIQGIGDMFVDAWGHVQEFGENVKTAFDGVLALFRGDESGGIDLLKTLGLNDGQIEMITGAVDRIKETFETMKENINTVVGAVKDFFIEQFQSVKEWWDSDGAMIFSAMETFIGNVFKGIENVVQFGLDFVKGLFETFAPIVEGIWNTLWPVIETVAKNVWENIKLTIGIAMDVVMGIISGVSALIEGDWSRFGEVLKETAESIWNRVTEFFGNMKENSLELFGQLFEGAGQWFSDLWSDITGKVSDIKNDVVGYFTGLKDDAIQRVTDMFNSVTGWFSDLWSDTTQSAKDIYNDVTGSFTDMKDGAVERSREMWDGVSGWFSDTWSDATDSASDLYTDATTSFSNMKDDTIDSARSMWSGVTDFFGDIWDDANELFNNMVDGAKELPGRIGDAIKNMASKAVDGVKSMGNSMAGGLQNVVDGVTGGLNDILDAIGVGNLIPSISIPTFSTGTNTSHGQGRVGAGGNYATFSTGTLNGRIAQDMQGILNDVGPGNGTNGAVQEVIERGGKLLAPQGRDALVELKKGDRIYNGAETQSMISAGLIPRFSQGSGTEGGNSGSEGGLWSSLKDIVSNVWSFISSPGEAFSALMDSVIPDFGFLDGFAGKMVTGAWDLITGGIKDFITNIFKENEGALGSGSKVGFMNFPMTTPYSPNSPVPGYPRSFNNGHHYGIDYGTPIGTPVHAPMGGQLSSLMNAGGGLIAKLVTGELKQFFMHMSSVQPSGSVGQGDLIGRTGNSGLWTTGPHIHWQAQQGSDVLNRNTVNPLDVIGYSNGGIVNKRQIAEIAEDGPEAVIPLSTSKRGRANQLYDAVGGRIGRDDSKHYDRMINNQQTQIDQMTQAINVLLGIEDKSGVTESDIGRANDKYNARQTSKRGVTTGRLNYV